MSITDTSSFRNFVDLESQARAADGMTVAMLTTFYANPEELNWEELDHSKAYWQATNHRNTISSLKSNAEISGIPYSMIDRMGNESYRVVCDSQAEQLIEGTEAVLRFIQAKEDVSCQCT